MPWTEGDRDAGTKKVQRRTRKDREIPEKEREVRKTDREREIEKREREKRERDV